ncbi:MAG: sulfate adenylyltransferase subunit CysD [Acidimicrobiales bacterium]
MGALPKHLQQLVDESIFIFREAVAEAERPVLLYSIGKDSSVLLDLALKAFAPGKPPFPLLHVDTTWKFQAMYAFRNQVAERYGLELIVHQNPYCLEHDINPFDHGSATHTELWKTDGLIQALQSAKFDVAFGGARRDEERSRAKERVFSVRSASQGWDPKAQRPELWNLYNNKLAPGQSLRVFPLSNWTELDIWQYIRIQEIEIVPLYFAAPRPVVERDGMLIMIDDDRFPLADGETPTMRKVRFRTLGCYPLSGAVESDAETLDQIIEELEAAATSERQGRVIDRDGVASMERKRQRGYF